MSVEEISFEHDVAVNIVDFDETLVGVFSSTDSFGGTIVGFSTCKLAQMDS